MRPRRFAMARTEIRESPVKDHRVGWTSGARKTEMGLTHIRRMQVFSLAWLVTGSFLVACDEEEPLVRPPDTVTLSGMVWEMPLQTPLAGAEVQLITNEFTMGDPDYRRPCDCEGDLCSVRTTSDGEGKWRMDVPVKYDEMWAPLDLLIKVSKGRNPPQFNLFSLSTGTQGDLQVLNPLFYLLFSLNALIAGADPDEVAVLFGVAIGFVDVAYPQEIATIPDVRITAEGGSPTEELPITYLGETGLPDPSLTKTSKLGVYYVAVPNATDAGAPLIQISGEKPDSVFVGGYYPACPGSSTGVAVIDPYFQP
jgi:hypothetical protein